MDILWAHTVRYRVCGVKLMIVTANLLADHPQVFFHDPPQHWSSGDGPVCLQS